MRRIHFKALLLLSIGFGVLSCQKDDKEEGGVVPVPEQEQQTIIISGISPEKASLADTITIFGVGFGTDTSKVEIAFHEAKGKIISVSETQIKVTIPDGAINTKLGVTINGKTLEGPEFKVDPWRMLKKFTGEYIQYGAVGFTIENKGYIGLGCTSFDNCTNKGFWQYDKDQETWTQIADFPGNSRTDATTFSINGKGYVFGGHRDTYSSILYYKDLYEYNPEANSWTKKADFPGQTRTYAVSFVINNIGYVGAGYNYFSNPKNLEDFYAYDPASDTWTKKANFGGGTTGAAVHFTLNEKGYVLAGRKEGESKNDLWEYSPATDEWTMKAPYTGSKMNGAFGFSLNNKGYAAIGMESYQRFAMWRYNPESNYWEEKTGSTLNSDAVVITIGDKAYFVDPRASTVKEYYSKPE